MSGPVRIALIAAVARNGVIGRDGAMPWRLATDLRHFRRVTLGKPVIMGRKTFQSLGKPLDKRDNIVVTRSLDFAPAGVIVRHSLAEALAEARSIAAARGQGEVMVIGGGEIYAAALAVAGRVYLTEIDAEIEGDTRFPALSPGDWREVSREAQPPGPGDDHAFVFRVLERTGAPTTA